MEEAKAHQRLHGGTLYRPRVYERPRKRTRAAAAVTAPPAPLSQDGDGAAIADSGGLI
jgi:hypothetical protein